MTFSFRAERNQVVHKARPAPPALLNRPACHLNRHPCGPATPLTHTAPGQRLQVNESAMRLAAPAQHFFPPLLLRLPLDLHSNMILSRSSFLSFTHPILVSRRDV